MASEHGDMEAITPPANADKNIKIQCSIIFTSIHYSFINSTM
jgi:hypothetical protein